MRRIPALCLMALLLLVPGGRPAAAQDEPWAVAVTPLPLEVVTAGPVTLAATVWAEPRALVEILLDDEAVLQQRHGQADRRVHEVTVEAAAGDHVVLVRVDGRVRLAWRFAAQDGVIEDRTVSDDAGVQSVALARRQHPEGAAEALLVGSAAVADALAGIPLATALDAPLLITDPDGLGEDVAAALTDLVEPGGRVIVLGGPRAVGPDVVRSLEQLGFSVDRLGGADRTETATIVAGRLPVTDQGQRTAHLVTDSLPADAISVSVTAALTGSPVLLTGQDRLSDSTATELGRAGTQHVVVVGGTAAIGEEVLADIADLGMSAERVAGADRLETAALLAARLPHDGGEGVALTTSEDPLAALVAALDSASDRRPLLYVDGGLLGPTARSTIAARPPGPIVIYGATVDLATARTARTVMRAEGRTVTVGGLDPEVGTTRSSPTLPPLHLQTSGPVDTTRSAVTVVVDGVPRTATLRATPQGVTVMAEDPSLPSRRATVRLLGRLHGLTGAAWTPLDHSFTQEALRLYARAGGVALHQPSERVEVLGFHEASNDGALEQVPTPDAPPWLVMASRGRNTAPTSAVDVVMPVDAPVLSPVTGVVVVAQPYLLYCRHDDEMLVIAPDDRPDLRLTVLHVTGLQVEPGDRVRGGQTVIASGARPLPFHSQVDDHSGEDDDPHVHVQLVDPSLSTRPPATCG